jgi:hypothetical protein
MATNFTIKQVHDAYFEGYHRGLSHVNTDIKEEPHDKKSDVISALMHLELTADFIGKNYDYGFELSIRRDLQTLRDFIGQ